ncbi:Structure-specific endonuclease subunit SLX4 [Lecanosticta acicola]|uniref:Structure-specific endonuclease subunit SLX4 n=1 Tax=Lecanosticta acicola TaxID=111012 RepID=A0AAI8Z2L1_9PEZI|nr:Structure-specific endonuclease subunit SLX4 [Lecanosticta acicola]
MTGRSPIVLESSPHFRAPSITPPSHRASSSVNDSSSPGLLSPSTLFGPASTGVKSGSRAQQRPEGASTAFASAEGLRKAEQLEAERKTRERHNADNAKGADVAKVSKDGATSKKSTATLAKPKARQAITDLTEGSVRQQSPLQSRAYQDLTLRKDSAGSLPRISPLAQENDHSVMTTLKKPAVPLSEYDFVAEDMPPPAKPAAHTTKPDRRLRAKTSKPDSVAKVKKPRKPAVKATETVVKPPPKKPRKRFTKSESIILNSDEPEMLAESTVGLGDVTKRYNAADIGAFAHVEGSTNLHTNDVDVQRVTALESGARESTSEKSTYFADDTNNIGKTCLSENNITARSQSHSVLSATNSAKCHPPPVDSTEKSKASPKADLAEQSDMPDNATLTSPEEPQRCLLSVLSGFGYSEQNAVGVMSERTESGQALTKRRRIELADAGTVGPAMRKAAEAPAPEPVKKAKAVKKKPQTITDLATKAYREPAQETTEQDSVSAFFAPQKQEANTEAGVTNAAAPKKPKKPRKPKTKKADVEGSARANAGGQSAKPKKTKAKSNDAASMAKLYSPGAARTVERNQDFLFGTSSQLAVEESPTFIREMQMVLQESEVLAALSSSPQLKSRIRISSAPEGTSLSIGQAFRDLWCTSARDHGGDTLDSLRPNRAATPSLITEGDDRERRLLPNSPGTLNTTKMHGGNEGLVTVEDAPVDTEVVPLRADEAVPNAGHPPSDDSWMMLKSDSTVADIANVADTAVVSKQTLVEPLPLQPPSMQRAATSPTRLRAALEDLDANAGLFARTSPVKGINFGQRTYTTDVRAEQAKRPRGRPRKDASASRAAPESPKRRGRPPKVERMVADSAPLYSRIVSSKTGLSASQPTTSSGFVNIDEISDSDSPATPSPPRRRATSSPPAVQPLTLGVVQSPSVKAKAPAAVTSTLKPGDADWPTIQDKLFPRITQVVTSVPRSDDMDNPTWHEKILLYDPIVLEDLTAWLNEQDIRIEIQRLKPKAKTKGRKKKGEEVEEPEYETVRKELEPCMVQKWCEDKSICCLWKEGLRGGVRTRY